MKQLYHYSILLSRRLVSRKMTNQVVEKIDSTPLLSLIMTESFC